MRIVKRYTLESRLGRRMAREGRKLVMTRRCGPTRYAVLNGDRIELWCDLVELARALGCMAADEELAKATTTIIKTLPKSEDR